MSDPEAPAAAAASGDIRGSIRAGEPPSSALANVVNSVAVTAVMAFFTIYCLYSEDSKIRFFNPACAGGDCDEFGGSDPLFAYVSLIAFVLFAIEICTNCIVTPGYWNYPDFSKMGDSSMELTSRLSYVMPGSFYFWLDVLSTASLVFEIPVIMKGFGLETTISEEETVSAISQNTDGGGGDISDNAEQARASKASRAGARAGKVVKIIRMVRLIRLVKLFKYAEKQKDAKEKGKDGQVIPEVTENFDDEEEEMPESHVGTEMTERTTKKVIVGVLCMLIAIPNLQSDPVDFSKNYAVRLLSAQRFEASNRWSELNVTNEEKEEDADYSRMKNAWQLTEKYVLKETGCFNIEYAYFSDPEHTVFGKRHGEGYVTSAEDEDLRGPEFNTFSLNNNVTKITAMFSVKKDVNDASDKSLMLTTVVILLLGGITMAFTQDVNNMVLRPIETMIELVKEISENPLAKEFKSASNIHKKNDGMETTLILQTITKIAGLMRVGFGEAGAEIIGKNLAKSDSAGMSLLGDGVKIKSIFGFCDIRNFTDTTECLQEEVMLFVNRIANILHGIVVQCHGAANKNIGDAFLLTWKLHDDRMVKGGTQEYVADEALLSLLKTTAEMARHEDFICNFSSTALSILYERMPGYKCKMGCGLHMGWAVEGAIGSDKKIDASYISPHVNWSEFLESSTKEYGVPVLMSEPFWKLLSPVLKKLTRQVDHIKKSASDEVTGLYTYDVNPDFDFKSMQMISTSGTVRHRPAQAERSRRTPTLTKKEIGTGVPGRATQRSNAGGRRKTNQAGSLMSKTGSTKTVEEEPAHHHAAHNHKAATGSHNSLGDAPVIVLPKYTTDIWKTDEDLIAMRTHMSDEIFELFENGMKEFIKGQWGDAKAYFNNVLKITNDQDGPSKNILRHIEEDYGGEPPPGWQGYRDMS